MKMLANHRHRWSRGGGAPIREHLQPIFVCTCPPTFRTVLPVAKKRVCCCLIHFSLFFCVVFPQFLPSVLTNTNLSPRAFRLVPPLLFTPLLTLSHSLPPFPSHFIGGTNPPKQQQKSSSTHRNQVYSVQGTTIDILLLLLLLLLLFFFFFWGCVFCF